MSIKVGDEVAIHFTAKLENGRVAETTRGKKPQRYEIGAGTLLPGLEEALIGLRRGDRKKVKVPPEKGFGKRNEGLIEEVPKSIFKQGQKLSRGMLVELQCRDGDRCLASVRSVKKNSVVVDMNHPYAGRTLSFDVEIVNVRTASS
ncbi:peptidylprolyl isomerase [Candidatus Bathyarchaeota archaeon]|nr:peptidylprolyl isomerase [Candidatus Bathyarchaeota archaeon]